MTTARLFLTNCLIWLLTLASPAGAGHFIAADLQKGIAQSIFAGLQEGAPKQQPGQSDEDYAAVYAAWKNDVAGQAKLLGAVVGYTTSGGQAVNVSNAATIAESGARHNYLSHTQLEEYQRAWRECGDDQSCIRDVIARFTEMSLAQQHELAMCGNDLACLAPHLQAMAAARDHPLWQPMVDALWGPHGLTLGELEYQAHQVYLNYDHDVGNPFPLSLFSGWLTREHGEAYGSYAGWAAANCGGISGAACMDDFQKVLTVSAHWEGYRAGSEAFLTSATIGLGGGLAIGIAPSAVGTMRLCAANPLCWAEVAGIGGEIGLGLTGATAGQTFFTVAGQTSAVAGAVVLQHGDEIIRVIDDLGRAFTPVSQYVDDAGRFIVRSADGATGYLDGGGRFVQTGAPNRLALIDDLQASGAKITPENVVDIQKLPDGRTVWLETGNNSAGLQHINRHADEFAQKGILQDQIPDAVFSALQHNNVVGYQGAGTGRPIYEYTFNGQTHRMAITVGDNGFIVGANPTSLP